METRFPALSTHEGRVSLPRPSFHHVVHVNQICKCFQRVLKRREPTHQRAANSLCVGSSLTSTGEDLLAHVAKLTESCAQVPGVSWRAQVVMHGVGELGQRGPTAM
jgi:hypothetical protein